MAMTYSSLIAAKGTSGSIATWVSYTKLDLPVIVDEAQALIYGEGRLRTREMTTGFDFTMAVGGSYQALPTGFLDPIGPINTPTNNSQIKHKDSNFVQRNRNYTETTGTLGASPFTTTSGSAAVSVALTAHNFTQDSVFNVTGATAVNGITPNGTFPISSITDANDFVIDTSILGTTATGSGAGGGSSVTYICDSLTPGTPYYWSIWDERIKFEQAFFQTTLCRLQFYKSLSLLSATNQTNFLTTRYPNLMRVACMAAAADFMQDDTAYQKQMTRLASMIEKISAENDMHMRGLELDPEIP